jgi:hypothetical protein
MAVNIIVVQIQGTGNLGLPIVIFMKKLKAHKKLIKGSEIKNVGIIGLLD